MKKTVSQRFFEKTKRDELSGCLMWMAAKCKDGYGAFGFMGNRSSKAHRVAFYLAHDRWPHPCCCHRCDNPSCVEITHLFEGTPSDNNKDRASKGRNGVLIAERHWTHLYPEMVRRGPLHNSKIHPESVSRGDSHYCRRTPEKHVKGERHGHSKLTTEQVIEIIASRERLKILSDKYGVSQSVISEIRNRKAWKHVV